MVVNQYIEMLFERQCSVLEQEWALESDKLFKSQLHHFLDVLLGELKQTNKTKNFFQFQFPNQQSGDNNIALHSCCRNWQ